MLEKMSRDHQSLNYEDTHSGNHECQSVRIAKLHLSSPTARSCWVGFLISSNMARTAKFNSRFIWKTLVQLLKLSIADLSSTS